MEECLFCNIVSRSVPSRPVFEDDEVMAFHDIHPKAPVHVLIVPKKHISSMNDLSDADQMIAGKLLLTARTLAQTLGVADAGYKLVINTGKDGGQLVGHLHIHLLGGKHLEMGI